VTQTLTTPAEFDVKVARDMSEATLQQNVEQMMGVFGWLSYHTHDSRRSNAGFPDLVAVRGHRLIFAELKAETGKYRPGQQEWLDALRRVQLEDFDGDLPEVYTWRPSNWLKREIEAVLR
jgi:hypothetical protein